MKFFARLRYIYRFRGLIYSFVARDLKTRYRGSALGFLWSFLDPLINSAVLWAVYTFIFAKGIPNLPLFLISGVISWNFFGGTIAGSTLSVVSNGNLLKKIRLPREVFPIATMLANLVHYTLAFLVLIIVVVITHPPFNPVAWLFIPIVVALIALVALGFGLTLSAISVYFRDTPHITDSVLRIWYFMTPIFYQVSAVPKRYLNVYLLNPGASGVTALREIVLNGRIPEPKLFLFLGGAAVILMVIGMSTFSRLEKGFADEV